MIAACYSFVIHRLSIVYNTEYHRNIDKNYTVFAHIVIPKHTNLNDDYIHVLSKPSKLSIHINTKLFASG